MISKKSIIISLVLIIILAGAYFFIDFSNDANEEVATENENTESVSSGKAIFETDKDSISSITITNENDSFEFYRDGETWLARGHEDVAYNQSFVFSLSLDFVSVTPALTVEEDSTNKSSFGFDAPRATAVVKTTDGKTATFYLGNPTKGGNGHYFMMDGDDNIYTISTIVANNMTKKLDDFRDLSLVDVELTDVTEVKMSVIGLGDVTIKHNKEDNGDMTTSWQMTEPFEIGVYDESFTEMILTPMLAVSTNEFMSDNPTEEQLKAFGLVDADLFYEITTADETIRVDVGNAYNGGVYVKRTDKPTIYYISASAFSFLDVDVLQYVNNFAYLPNHSDVSEISYKKGSETYALKIDNKNYSINGNGIKGELFSEYYQKLFNVKIRGIITSENKEDVVFSYSVKKTDGSVDNISFVRVNSKYSNVYVNDKAIFYVFTEDVENASNALPGLYEKSKNPEPDDDKTEEAPKAFNWLSLVVVILILLLVVSFPVSLLLNSKNKKKR